MYPGLTALVLVYFIAAWHVLRGVSEIVVAIRLREESRGEGWLIAAGVLSVLCGLILCARPGAGAGALIWVVGSFAVLLGIMRIVLGIKLKGSRPATAELKALGRRELPETADPDLLRPEAKRAGFDHQEVRGAAGAFDAPRAQVLSSIRGGSSRRSRAKLHLFGRRRLG